MNTTFIKWSALLLWMAIAVSCDDEVITEGGTGGGKTIVSFEGSTKTVAENAVEQTVTLTFTKPLAKDAELTLKVDGKFAENFTTVPAISDGFIKISVARAATSTTFKILPVNNTEKDGDRVASVSIHNLSVPFLSVTNKAITITISDDESESSLLSAANFVEQSITLKETATTWIQYQVHFSEALAVDSEVKISVTADKGTYGVDFTSDPAAQDGTITLQVAQGLRVIAFRIRPLDNDRISGDLAVDLTITETSGSIRKGNKLTQVLTIKDDELEGRPRGYEVTAGNRIIKRFYEYDAHERISKVHWEDYSPYLTQGTNTYHYDANNRLSSIEKYPGREERYYWSGDRIVKSETIRDGVLHAYTEYAYDDAGNVGAVVSYHLQDDGSFAKGFFTVYLYFMDGNLYKSLTYHDSDDPENPHLVSTRTYDNYIQTENPFPMTEVLPNIKMQKTLATTYRVEDSTGDLLYHMTYEFREDGQPEKRIASSGTDVQTAVYHYY